MSMSANIFILSIFHPEAEELPHPVLVGLVSHPGHHLDHVELLAVVDRLLNDLEISFLYPSICLDAWWLTHSFSDYNIVY